MVLERLIGQEEKTKRHIETVIAGEIDRFDDIRTFLSIVGKPRQVLSVVQIRGECREIFGR
jgi:rRNA processing protein Krr1/Pno1